MIVCLENVLSPSHVKAFVKILKSESLYESGDRTAGKAAKAAKQNLQAIADKPEVSRIVAQVREDLSKHTAFQSCAIPARIGRVMVSRYEPGMEYGTHFDDAFIAGVRTDISFTLFLSEMDEYEGGELELVTSTGSQAIKLPPGCAVVYPSDHLHGVRPVTKGTRLAVVGWVQSRIRSTAERQMLFELSEATSQIEGDSAQEGLLRLKYVRNNLLRMWAE